ncbi:anti-sigma F factor [Hominifimenecus sp. rT4P-3]|uniref:anti-sigma F factor n=1 Tax=Hominifimenecus sp. rT4P-3 TaxID=3242979 RepID=UPI003DA4C94D
MKEEQREKMTLTMESRSRNEAFARAVVAAFVARLDPTMEELEDIRTAVSEAVTNAVVHGYRDSEGEIRLSAEIEGNALKLEIQDWGVGIADVEKAMEPLFTTCPEGERSGMGFSFMEAFMDNLTVHSAPGEGTTVYMEKKIGLGDGNGNG